MSKPTLALVGRPNVGKSTLFNRLTRSRDALVADLPGLTRDRHYGTARVGDKSFLVVDTGGLEPVAKDGIFSEMARQTDQAIAESDVVVFLVDARQGLTPQDRVIAERLRRLERPVILAVNKAEGIASDIAVAEFHALGLGNPIPISASHGEGVNELISNALAPFPADTESVSEDDLRPRVAIVGRPNAGKSTLVNRLLGEERMIAFDEPGTTRDAIYVDLHWKGSDYVLIDTAGLRRRGKVFESVEKFSVVKTLQAIADANVVILLLDGRAEVAEQDAHIAGFILDEGRALVVAVNKCDNLSTEQREKIKKDLERKLDFLSFARFHHVSAKDGMGLAPLFQSVDEAFAAARAKLSTPKLTRAMQAALERHQPPMAGLFRPKLRYAHQGGTNPPTVVIHGTNTTKLPESYKRYLENSFRTAFNLAGTPMRIELREGANPYRARGQRALTGAAAERARSEKRRRKKVFGP